MRQLVSSVSPKGQVTLPVEVRRLLGVKLQDKIAFEVDEGQVRIGPARFTLESALGSVEPPTRTEDFESLSREAKEAHLEKSGRL